MDESDQRLAAGRSGEHSEEQRRMHWRWVVVTTIVGLVATTGLWWAARTFSRAHVNVAAREWAMPFWQETFEPRAPTVGYRLPDSIVLPRIEKNGDGSIVVHCTDSFGKDGPRTPDEIVLAKSQRSGEKLADGAEVASARLVAEVPEFGRVQLLAVGLLSFGDMEKSHPLRRRLEEDGEMPPLPPGVDIFIAQEPEFPDIKFRFYDPVDLAPMDVETIKSLLHPADRNFMEASEGIPAESLVGEVETVLRMVWRIDPDSEISKPDTSAAGMDASAAAAKSNATPSPWQWQVARPNLFDATSHVELSGRGRVTMVPYAAEHSLFFIESYYLFASRPWRYVLDFHHGAVQRRELAMDPGSIADFTDFRVYLHSQQTGGSYRGQHGGENPYFEFTPYRDLPTKNPGIVDLLYRVCPDGYADSSRFVIRNPLGDVRVIPLRAPGIAHASTTLPTSQISEAEVEHLPKFHRLVFDVPGFPGLPELPQSGNLMDVPLGDRWIENCSELSDIISHGLMLSAYGWDFDSSAVEAAGVVPRLAKENETLGDLLEITKQYCYKGQKIGVSSREHKIFVAPTLGARAQGWWSGFKSRLFP